VNSLPSTPRPPRPRRRLATCAAAAGLALGLSAGRADALTYYVDCAAGNDANIGTSQAAAWRSLTRASQPTYGPGDQILLKRGCLFANQTFMARGSGTPAAPILLADYGTGNLPAIDADRYAAVWMENVKSWTVRNLDVTQHGSTPESLNANFEPIAGTGAFLYGIVEVRGRGPVGVKACGEPCTARNIRLESLKVHDGQWNGIRVSGGEYDLDTNIYGYVDGVTITDLEAWNNHKAGVEATSTYTKNISYAVTNIQVLDCYARDNGGDGVVLGPVDHGLIDGCLTPYNGRLRDARLGAWSWDSHDVVIQFSESHHNMTPANDGGARDGGGFDCDLGSEDCLIQYTWSHDNEGEGYLLMQWPIGYGYARGQSHNIHLRYNVGERDAKKLASGIFIFGGPNPVVVHNNTIYYEPDRLAGSEMAEGEGAAISTSKWGKSGVPTAHIYNNIFITNGTVNPQAVSNNMKSGGSGTFFIDNNLWWRVEGGVRFHWANSVITTFAGWRAKGFDANGVNANPGVVGPLGGGPAAYLLAAGSPAIDAGRVVTAGLRGMGTRDYFGTATPRGARYDIGAAEY
jgi:parallel beta helix pectate lyase-like protein